MAKRYSEPFKRKIIDRLTGPNAPTPQQLSREVGLPQTTLVDWSRQARNLPFVTKTDRPHLNRRSVADKIRLLAGTSNLEGEALLAYLKTEGVTLAEFEQWRLALEEGVSGSAAAKRIRVLE